jgi:hypothetical protein
MEYKNYLFLFFIIIILLFLYTMYYKKNSKENFETYKYAPYNYVDTGSEPLTFYKYPIYKKPYMFPYKFYTSYPYSHMTHYESNI